ncbi:CRTAC1 family protein [Gimesia chilikensis]|uniref:CRTAC1 family protein n=1 Tax=Gimesia chilikensis TaxID=2605989 RepID=UPI0011EC5EBC|nr:CRTAC1 family protein [Gimesia chilikensis]KAA0133085.1 CRTAC1 family protein [Gimesia chilikensis]
MSNFRFRRNTASRLLQLMTWTVCLLNCPSIADLVRLSAAEPADKIHLKDVTDAVQLSFQHRSPLTVTRHLHLMMGSGVGWFDFDNDGFPDLFCAQGEEWQSALRKKQVADLDWSHRMFRNVEGRAFQDITRASGLTGFGYGMGMAVGDFNHDGFEDLYVSVFGRNQLYANNGDGTFTDISQAAHVDHPGYGASSTWVDLNGDGLLDLYIANYLEIDREHYPLCSRRVDNSRVYFVCHPRYVPGEYDVVYRNLGNGKFLDVSQQSGLHSEPARQGLGVFAADYDLDGDQDIYVANDSVANQLWINDGRGNFTDQALIAGLAFNREGDREAGMGLAGADYNGDGTLDLFVTNYFGETNTLYRNEGALFFLDVTDETGLAAPSRVRLGFGTSFVDFNNDGWEDLFVANGHVHDRLAQLGKSEPFEQEPQLFRNESGTRFREISDSAGPFFQTRRVGRGSATADFNRDGLADLAVSHLNQKVVLLQNQTRTTGQSIALKLIGTEANRSAIGAVVEITAGKRKLMRLRKGSSSYLSADESEILVGLGEQRNAVTVKVIWPGGKSEIWTGFKPGQHYTLIEGNSDSQKSTPSQSEE